tara:strand:- start:6682 stop:7059 length:378 start_codon:yes stop_codon:yes gene_type:complete
MATEKNNNFGNFDNFLVDMLDLEPQMAFMTSVAQTQSPFASGSFGTEPMRARATDYFRSQYPSSYQQYMGKLGSEIRSGVGPDQLSTFSDFLEGSPFTQRYANLTPSQKGLSTQRFAPSTRYIFY